MSKLNLIRAMLLLFLIALVAFPIVGVIAATDASEPGASASGPLFQEEGPGRNLGPDDWAARLPIACVMGAIVLIVDAVVIGIIIRNRRRGRYAR